MRQSKPLHLRSTCEVEIIAAALAYETTVAAPVVYETAIATVPSIYFTIVA